MPYRKITYLEQMWYLFKYKLRQLLRRERRRRND